MAEPSTSECSNTPNTGQLLKNATPGGSWKFMSKFSTGYFKAVSGLAINQDDNIVVSTSRKGVRVYTKNGDVKLTMYDSCGIVDTGVLPGNQYVTAPEVFATVRKGMTIYNPKGKPAINFPIKNMNDELSIAKSVAVDSNNKIIVGQYESTISIYNADGSLVSKFATESPLLLLAITSNGEIVCSYCKNNDSNCDKSVYGTSLHLMDYSGGNLREIKPPDEVKKWSPSFVCCGQGEILVTNQHYGDPAGVFRYTSEGDYLDCVTTDVDRPAGIVLSRDGTELFVGDNINEVKIFKRP